MDRRCSLTRASPSATHPPALRCAPRCEPMCGRNTDRIEKLWARADEGSILSRNYDVPPFRIYILLSTFEKHAWRQQTQPEDCYIAIINYSRIDSYTERKI